MPPSQQAARTPVSSVPTCADMGPLLRGQMDDEDSEGPKKEALIIGACERDHWPQAVLECAASATEPTVQDCLAQLPEEAHARYDKALEKYGHRDEEVESDAPGEDLISCDAAFAATAVDLWPPAVSSEAERALATKLRGQSLRMSCETELWETSAKKCIASTPASGIGVCWDMLEVAQRAAVGSAIAEADELRAKNMKAQAKPASVTCEKAVAAHYATAKWTGKAPELKGADRTKAIAASRKAMLASCKGWSIEARACIVADDRDACYALGGTSAMTWGYPATGGLPPTGIPECDDYAAAVVALGKCQAIPEATRKIMMDAFLQAADAWKSLPAADRAAAAAGCKAAADATRQAAAACT